MTENVTVVLPAHNEAGSIAEVVRRCREHTPDVLEVLVVDDGSTDGTRRVATEAGARVVRLQPNRGKGEAIRCGLRDARGEVVVLMDADGQDDPADVPRLLDALTPDVDLVIGSRFLGHFEPGAIRPMDKVVTHMLTQLLNALYGVRLTDVLAGFRCGRRDILRDAGTTAAAYDIEVDMIINILERGGRIVDVAVSREARREGSSDLRRFRDGLRILRRIVSGRVPALG